MSQSSSLYLKNAAVGLLLVLPIVLVVGVREPPKKTDQPPIITLRETDGYTFVTGSAALSDSLIAALETTITATLKTTADDYDCDIIEVIGHTDGKVVRSKSNMDSLMVAFIDGTTERLEPGSNVDLGLMRAWAVIDFLRRQPQLRHLSFRGYSAGQTLNPDGSYAKFGFLDEPGRRRIEIRARRSQ